MQCVIRTWQSTVGKTADSLIPYTASEDQTQDFHHGGQAFIPDQERRSNATFLKLGNSAVAMKEVFNLRKSTRKYWRLEGIFSP